MLRSNLCYPYPVLRSESIDYRTDVFKVYLQEVITTQDGYNLNFDFKITNDNLNNLINNNKAKIGVLVKSSSVWYRKFFDLTNQNNIFLSSREVYGKVELLPCVVATSRIEHYYSDNFEEEYKITSISINPGEYLAIGDELSFDALLDTDIFKNTASIFELAPTNEKNISYDINSDKIVIFVPKDIHQKYVSVALNATSPKSILNSTLVFPVLLSVIYEIKKDGELYEDKKWYKTIKKTIETKASSKTIAGLDFSGEIDDPLLVAQSLTNGLTISSFNKLEEILTMGDN